MLLRRDDEKLKSAKWERTEKRFFFFRLIEQISGGIIRRKKRSVRSEILLP